MVTIKHHPNFIYIFVLAATGHFGHVIFPTIRQYQRIFFRQCCQYHPRIRFSHSCIFIRSSSRVRFLFSTTRSTGRKNHLSSLLLLILSIVFAGSHEVVGLVLFHFFYLFFSGEVTVASSGS